MSEHKEGEVIGGHLPIGKPGKGIDLKLPPFHPTPGKPAGSLEKQQEKPK